MTFEKASLKDIEVLTDLRIAYLQDDLGNIYESEGFGGVYSSNGWTGEWSSNRVFEKVNEKASKLIITPKVSVSKWNREINGPESQEKTLDSIEIELE